MNLDKYLQYNKGCVELYIFWHVLTAIGQKLKTWKEWKKNEEYIQNVYKQFYITFLFVLALHTKRM